MTNRAKQGVWFKMGKPSLNQPHSLEHGGTEWRFNNISQQRHNFPPVPMGLMCFDDYRQYEYGETLLYRFGLGYCLEFGSSVDADNHRVLANYISATSVFLIEILHKIISKPLARCCSTIEVATTDRSPAVSALFLTFRFLFSLGLITKTVPTSDFTTENSGHERKEKLW